MDLLRFIYKVLNKEKVYLSKDRSCSHPKIAGILRVRNEELILEDTLDHLSSFCDIIVAYDDASTDSTFDILRSHPKVAAIIKNYKWLTKVEDRIKCETTHRAALLKLAKSFYPQWVFCADADERYIGDIRGFVDSKESANVDLVRIMLFDAYMTEDDQLPYLRGQQLLNFRKHFGPERRDIIMLWRANYDDIRYVGDDSREPIYSSGRRIITKFNCQHYGKSLSIQHWEETCDYYTKHFPYETYGQKWEQRKGKAIHRKSDFNNELFVWGEDLFCNSIVIHPIS